MLSRKSKRDELEAMGISPSNKSILGQGSLDQDLAFLGGYSKDHQV